MPPTPPPLASTLTTTLALLDQFSSSLSTSATVPSPTSRTNTPSPLPLLSASATSLKAQTTRLSLLAITNPFTPTAVASCLSEVNAAILPSLITAALLITPEEFTGGYSAEARSLVRGVIGETRGLVACLIKRSRDVRNVSAVGETEKGEIMEVTGRVWEGCDQVAGFVESGVGGFVVRKAGQWLELMKDAVRELEEWDPEEEVDGVFGGGIDGDEEEDGGDVQDNGVQNGDRATIQAGVKSEALKVLSRIPQSIHVVVKQRLEKLPKSALSVEATRTTVDAVVSRTRTISESIDESAEAMYMGDLELCLKKAGEARALTIEVVEAVVEPWDKTGGGGETKEDKYVKRALDWIRQVEPIGAKKVAQAWS